MQADLHGLRALVTGDASGTVARVTVPDQEPGRVPEPGLVGPRVRRAVS
jgi:hypothetical protein